MFIIRALEREGDKKFVLNAFSNLSKKVGSSLSLKVFNMSMGSPSPHYDLTFQLFNLVFKFHHFVLELFRFKAGITNYLASDIRLKSFPSN